MKIACILTWLLPACLFIGTSASNPFLGFSYTCFKVRHIMASSIGCPLFEHSWKKNYMFRYIQKNRFILIMKWCVKNNNNIKIWGFRECKNPKFALTSLITFTTLQVVAEDSSRTSIFVLLSIKKCFDIAFVTTLLSIFLV